MSDRVIVSIQNQIIQVTDAKLAFGSDFPEEYRRMLVEGTADDITTLMLMEELSPIIISVGTPATILIEERRRGLQALGVEDVQAEVDAAIKRMKQLGPNGLAKLAVHFMR